MNLLIVDDDEIFRRAIVRGYRACSVQQAATIEDGLAVARALQPEIILLDVNFADGWPTGLEALPSFREAAPRSQIIVVTALFREGAAEQAYAAGANGYCEKGDPEFLRKVAVAAMSLVDPPPSSH